VAGDEGKDHVTVRPQRIGQADRWANLGARRSSKGKGTRTTLCLVKKRISIF
jgi:hypothetical protein